MRTDVKTQRGDDLAAAVEKFLSDGSFTAPWDGEKWADLCMRLNDALCDYRGVPPRGEAP